MSLDGDELKSLSNGKKKEFLEQLKLFIKLFFSKELLMETARELEAEELARKAAAERERQAHPQRNGANHDPAFA